MKLSTSSLPKDMPCIPHMSNFNFSKLFIKYSGWREILPPIGNTSAVYYFYNKNYENIYIGKTVNLRARVRAHNTSKRIESKWVDEIEYIKYILCPSHLLNVVEANEICKYKPKYNIIHMQNIRFHEFINFNNIR